MEIFNFSTNQGRQIDRYGSTGASITPIIEHADDVSVVSIRIEPQGILALHPAAADQLLLVAAGEAFVSTENHDELLIEPGSAVLWRKGEMHQTRAGKNGLLAIVIEAKGLAGSIRMPPTGSVPGLPS